MNKGANHARPTVISPQERPPDVRAAGGRSTAIDRFISHYGAPAVEAVPRFFAGYFWLILKNVVGWLLILAALPIGITLPGPGGLPMFLLGFALVAFPGKRRITSHVLRGRPLRIEASIFTSVTTVISLLVIAIGLWLVGKKYDDLIRYFALDPHQSTPGFLVAIAGLCVIAGGVTWGVMRLGLLFANKLIRVVPKIRRFIRRVLRRWGIVLLPPPKKTPGLAGPSREDAEILELSEYSRQRFANWWYVGRPWLKRCLGLGMTAAMFFILIDPITSGWRGIEPYINRLSPRAFLSAVVVFVFVTVAFRVVTWRLILRQAGHELATVSATRIWGTAELGRYLPGAMWQLIGRAALVRPYGIGASRCGATQVFELLVFFLANLIVGIECMVWFGLDRIDSGARWLLLAVGFIAPLLGVLVHRRIASGLANTVLRNLGRPPADVTPSGRRLVVLLAWNIVGILAVGWCVWQIVCQPLGLSLEHVWIAAGAYTLAWCAGFAAFWAPAGLGVREVIFMLLLTGMLPDGIRDEMGRTNVAAFAGVLALVLRAWSIVAELIIALIGNSLDPAGLLQTLSSPKWKLVDRRT